MIVSYRILKKGDLDERAYQAQILNANTATAPTLDMFIDAVSLWNALKTSWESRCGPGLGDLLV